MKSKNQWLTAKCPICGKDYAHLKYYKPKTCGKFECIAEASKRELLNKSPKA
jgi:hypothetical protein